MNDSLHYLSVFAATTLIGLGLSLMTVPWLGSPTLLLVPALNL